MCVYIQGSSETFYPMYHHQCDHFQSGQFQTQGSQVNVLQCEECKDIGKENLKRKKIMLNTSRNINK